MLRHIKDFRTFVTMLRSAFYSIDSGARRPHFPA